MKKKNVGILGIWMLTGMLFTGCGSMADGKSQSKEESVSVQESQETDSSMEECAIREGFASLKPGSEYDSLYHSALCRQQGRDALPNASALAGLFLQFACFAPGVAV